MEKEPFNFRNWNDLLFENKNKDYGAYAIRESYSQNVARAFITSGAVIGALLLLAVISNLTGGKVIPPLAPPDRPLNPFNDFKLPQPEPPAAHSQPAHTTTSQRVPTHVTSQPDPEVQPPVTDTSSPVTEVTGTGHTGEADPIGETTIGSNVGSNVLIGTTGPRDFVEKMPSYRGGDEAMMRFIVRRLSYPRSARNQGIEGTVFVRFVISAEGNVVDVEVMKGIDPACDQEAARVVAMMKDWNPGIQNHVPVAVRMTLPIKFKLGDN